MNSTVRDRVTAALASFAEAKAAIESPFDVMSAAEIVSAVLQGRMPREGRCVNGLEYFVHGVGYTIMIDSGGQVHFDGGDGGIGDVFSAYDIQEFLKLRAMSTYQQ